MENQNTQQDQSEPQLTKKERRQMRRDERKVEQERTKKAGSTKNMLVWAGVIVLVAAAGFGLFRYLFSAPDDGSLSADLTKTCVNHGGISMHLHPDLRIIIDGEEQALSSNIGVSGGCMRPVHTHDNSGRLHAEFPRQTNLTLADFFKIWGKTFSSSQILDSVVDETHAITFTVNGEPSTDYENLILQDGARIEITYETISEEDHSMEQ